MTEKILASLTIVVVNSILLHFFNLSPLAFAVGGVMGIFSIKLLEAV